MDQIIYILCDLVQRNVVIFTNIAANYGSTPLENKEQQQLEIQRQTRANLSSGPTTFTVGKTASDRPFCPCFNSDSTLLRCCFGLNT